MGGVGGADLWGDQPGGGRAHAQAHPRARRRRDLAALGRAVRMGAGHRLRLAGPRDPPRSAERAPELPRRLRGPALCEPSARAHPLPEDPCAPRCPPAGWPGRSAGALGRATRRRGHGAAGAPPGGGGRAPDRAGAGLSCAGGRTEEGRDRVPGITGSDGARGFCGRARARSPRGIAPWPDARRTTPRRPAHRAGRCRRARVRLARPAAAPGPRAAACRGAAGRRGHGDAAGAAAR